MICNLGARAVGHRCASLSFDIYATPFFLDVVPLAPLVSARTPAVTLTGFLSGLALSDLCAIPGNVLGGWARWEIPQALGEFSTQLLVLLAASHYASSSSA